MASLLFFTPSFSLKPNNKYESHFIRPIKKSPHLSPLPSKILPPKISPLKFSAHDQEEHAKPPSSSSSVTVISDENVDGKPSGEHEQTEEEEEAQRKQQEADWKTDEEFKKFMGNPSIEAAIKLEKKRADRKLKELDTEAENNPIVGFFKRSVRERLKREKERLEKAEETFKALDLNKLRSCFGFDTFFVVDARRFGDGGIFVGNLRRPIEEVMPKLEKKLSEAAGGEVVLWFMEEKTDDITKQVLEKCPPGLCDNV